MRMTPRIRKVVAALKAYEPEQIYLFGSWARGEGDALSDIDLVVVKKTRKTFFNRLREIGGFLPPEIGAVDILIYTPAEIHRMQKEGNALIETVIAEGKLIYERKPQGRGATVVSAGRP